MGTCNSTYPYRVGRRKGGREERMKGKKEGLRS